MHLWLSIYSFEYKLYYKLTYHERYHSKMIDIWTNSLVMQFLEVPSYVEKLWSAALEVIFYLSKLCIASRNVDNDFLKIHIWQPGIVMLRQLQMGMALYQALSKTALQRTRLIRRKFLVEVFSCALYHRMNLIEHLLE